MQLSDEEYLARCIEVEAYREANDLHFTQRRMDYPTADELREYIKRKGWLLREDLPMFDGNNERMEGVHITRLRAKNDHAADPRLDLLQTSFAWTDNEQKDNAHCWIDFVLMRLWKLVGDMETGLATEAINQKQREGIQ